MNASLNIAIRQSRFARCSTAAAEIETALLVALVLMLARLIVALAIGASPAMSPLWDAAAAALLAVVLLVLQQSRLAAIAACWSLYHVGGVALYICTAACFAVGAKFAMRDADLAFVDRLVGFDWKGFLVFVDKHPLLNDAVLYPAYRSIFWQPIVAAVLLPLRGHSRDALILLLAAPLCIMLCCVVTTFVPAYGSYHFYGIAPSMHPHIGNLATGDGIAASIDWLRSSDPVGPYPIDKGGLLTFPSFHTTAAFLFLWSVRRERFLLIPAVPLNVAMLMATPLHGSHYIADMIAGAAIALLGLFALTKIMSIAPAVATASQRAMLSTAAAEGAYR